MTCVLIWYQVIWFSVRNVVVASITVCQSDNSLLERVVMKWSVSFHGSPVSGLRRSATLLNFWVVVIVKSLLSKGFPLNWIDSLPHTFISD